MQKAKLFSSSNSFLILFNVITVCWRGYINLGSHNDYVHMTVNHKRHFKDPVTGAHTENIVRTWGDVRENLQRMGVKPECTTHLACTVTTEDYICLEGVFVHCGRSKRRCTCSQRAGPTSGGLVNRIRY